MRTLFVLRPEPGAGRTVERARALGIEARALPLFEVQPVEWTAPDPAGFDALLLTSANAARVTARRLGPLARLPVHAVGSATAEAARASGLSLGSVGNGGVADLLARLPGEIRLLHLGGEDRVEAPGVTPLAVYRSAALPAPPLGDLEGQVAAVHSPRAGTRLNALAEAQGLDRASIALVAISAAAAAAAGSGWQAVMVAPEPADTALLALALLLCHDRRRG